MDGLHELLATLKRQNPDPDNFLGLLNVLVGRRIENSSGTLISAGLTWRNVAVWLKRIRWDKQAVRTLRLDPGALPPRDREHYWYTAIGLAHIDSKEAREAGDRMADALRALGYHVSQSPK